MPTVKHLHLANIILGILAISLTLLLPSDKEVLEKVKSRKYSLVCGIDTWQKITVIHPDKVVDFIGDIDSGTWLFKNGYSKNCDLIKIED